jgi:hypothetical protein
MTDQPTAGNPPSITAVIKFLKAAGFQHSRYRGSMSAPEGFGFYVSSANPREVEVRHREGDHAYEKRMRKLGITDHAKMPTDPDRARRIAEYAEALAPRYTVENFSGHSLYLKAREALPARPKGVPKAATVSKALMAAGVTHYPDGSTDVVGHAGYIWVASAVDQPDHTRIAVFEERFLDAVRAALTAEGWVFEESENSAHYIIKITGSTPDRPARLRKLRQQREARAIELAGREAVAKVEAGIEQEKAAQAAEEAEHLEVQPDEVPRHEPQEPAPAPAAYSRAGVGYRVGMRVTYRDNSGFWRHGEVLKIEPDETGVRRVHFRQDAYQVAPQRRAPKYMANNPGKRREEVTPHTDPVRVVALDDKDLSPEIIA